MKNDLRNTDTKERIIAEAGRLFRLGGYNHISLETIAKTLEITRPALYFHFPGGKEQLLTEVIRAFGVEMLARLEAAITEGTSAHQRLRNVLLNVARHSFLDQQELVLGRLDKLTPQAQQALEEGFRNLHRLVSGVIEEGIQAGELRAVDTNMAFFSFMGLCDQAGHYAEMQQCLSSELVGALPGDSEQMVDSLLDLWFGGLNGPKYSDCR